MGKSEREFQLKEEPGQATHDGWRLIIIIIILNTRSILGFLIQ